MIDVLENLYVFRWNRPGLAGRKGTLCRIIRRGKMNSCVVEFVRDHYHAVVSRNSVKRLNRLGL